MITNQFKLLPDNLIINLMNFLDFREVLNLEQVNKNFSQIVRRNETHIWKSIYKNIKFPIVVIYNENYNYKFNNYTFSINFPKKSLKDKLKLAFNSHQEYLNKKL